jgi:hypothetical protein
LSQSVENQRDTIPPSESGNWQNPVDSEVRFEYEMIDFGQAKKGEAVYGRFAFSNVGQQDLVIELVSTCECIRAEWSQGPIGPGQMGEIILLLDTTNEAADLFKTIDLIFVNVGPDGYPLVKQLYLKGKVD